ncbi:MAG: hypothetical protein II943_08920 [Victivallales bacterium]|nr:hypothetical protein [Victivallales bacterium]
MPPLVPMPVARTISVPTASRAVAVLLAMLGMALLRAADLDNDSLSSNSLTNTYLGKLCKCVTEEEIKDGIRDFAASFTEGWSFPRGPNCHTFVRDALENNCLEDE